MIQILKPVVSFLMFLVVLFSTATMLTIATELPDWVNVTMALTCSVLVGWYCWKLVAGEKLGMGVSMLCGALMLGGLGFIFGFLGPMVLNKDTSQATLLGIFVMAPIGALLGGIVGYVVASSQRAGDG